MTAAKHTSRHEMAVVNLATSALAWGWPVLLAFAATPFIVKGLGNDGYGIRGLVSSITGYFALLDLGLNGAVTKYLAEYRAKNDTGQTTELLGTTLTTFTALGLVGGLVIFFLAEWFTKNLFTIPASYYGQAILAFRLTGLGFFLSMLTWWGSSIAPGLQRFDVFNGISIGFGTITTFGMVIAVKLGYGLVGVVVANLIANAAAAVAYWVSARRLMPEIPVRFSFDKVMFRRTFMFGIYMVAFRVFALLFAQLDSVLIGAWLGTAAVTFYIVPQQVAQVVHGLNGKMMQIIFPMASELSSKGDSDRIDRLFVRSFNLSVFIGLAIAVPLAVVAGPLLRYWVSPEMAQHSTMVLELLLTTFFLSGLTAMPSNILGGVNSPQYTAIGAMLSGVFGVIFYFLLIKPFGINGVAAGKVISVAITVAYYMVICHKKSRYSWSKVLREASKTLSLALAIGLPAYYFLSSLPGNLVEVLLLAGAVSALYCLACWFSGVFDEAEKRSLAAVARRFAPACFGGQAA